VPASLRPAAPQADETVTARPVTWLDLVERWDLVTYDLSRLHRVDLHHPDTLARPWPGIRSMILGLLGDPNSRLRADLEE
jgi:hypothetical protein